MAASKLTIYNGALRILGERKLSSLSEGREPRRLLDDVWDNEGISTCLELGQWNFAIRSAQFDYDPSYSSPFGYQRQFAKPDDFVRTAGVCSDEYFRSPVVHYRDEAGFWFADHDTLFIRYVSDDEDYGLNYELWPHNFTRMVEAWFAVQIKQIASDSVQEAAERAFSDWQRKAKMTDALESPAQFKPYGSWVRARMSSYKDRTPRGGLY